MRRRSEPSLFQPKISASETKGDATTRAAQAIVDEEANARDAKTERLRATRLRKEAVEGTAPIKRIPEKKTRRKS
jgi:hypothetical protein